MKLYLHIGEVVGAGQVPFDMLRYDAAFPYREIDSAEIEGRQPLHGQRETRPIQIATYRTTKQDPWTHGRWRSFNHDVKIVDCREVSGR